MRSGLPPDEPNDQGGGEKGVLLQPCGANGQATTSSGPMNTTEHDCPLDPIRIEWQIVSQLFHKLLKPLGANRQRPVISKEPF